ncbi:MAG: hypothetical protein ACREOH_00305, partial [Candidatus Entotheonellia bacterium]
VAQAAGDSQAGVEDPGSGLGQGTSGHLGNAYDKSLKNENIIHSFRSKEKREQNIRMGGLFLT